MQLEGGCIPNIVRDCVDHIEQIGLDHDGLYTEPGSSARVRVMRQQYSLGLSPKLSDDPLNVTALLRDYLKELPAPFIPTNVFHQLAESLNASPEARKAHLANLSPATHDTLKFLASHLLKVSGRSSKNKMDLVTLGTVFGPLLIRSAGESAANPDAARVVSMLIQDQELLF